MSRTAPQIQAEIQSLQQAMPALSMSELPTAMVRLQALFSELGDLPTVNTEGGAVVAGNVQTDGGDFVGRDKNIYAPDPAAEARRTYLKKLRDQCNALPLAAMGDEQTTGESLGLNTVYIALDTRTPIDLTPAEKNEERYRRQNQRPLTALEAAAQHPRLVLLGDPGGGKSSFVRQLAADHATAVLDQQPDALLPLFMVLRDLAPRLQGLATTAPLTKAEEKALVQAIVGQWEADIAQLGGKSYCGQRLADELSEGHVLLIFDGLDELPEKSRRAVWVAIDTLLGQHRQVKQVIVTCRIRSYTGDARFPAFTDHTLAPFSKAKIEGFIKGWYTAQANLGRFKPAEATSRAADLHEAALRPELRELAENPLLLTVMAIIHQRETRLPNERVKLYSQAVDVLLNRWQKAKGFDISPALQALLKDSLRIRPLLERLAYDLHETQAAQAGARLHWGALLHLLKGEAYLGDVALAEEFLTYIDQRAGLLVGYGGSHAAESEKPPEFDFPHRTFQEYLAGCHLMRGVAKQILPVLRGKAQAQDYWRVPVQLGLEELHFNRRRQGDLALVAQGLLGKPATPRTQLWSGYVVDVVGLPDVLRELAELGGGEAYSARLQQALLPIVLDEQLGLTTMERAEAGRLLNWVEDPREGVGVVVRENGLKIPNIAWGKEVPMGRYTYVGEDGHEVKQAYQLAKYPVTYAQFQCFVEAEDFGDVRWWVGMSEEQEAHGTNYITKQLSDQAFPYANHPREQVSWYQAVAFCRWLSDKLGYEVRLPHEHEWEVAVRYNDGRIYPWGNEFDKDKANTRESSLEQTTAVGLYPNGRQPHLDLYDLSGNVLEWCQNKYEDPTQAEVDDSGDSRGLRGGSWFNFGSYARAAFRYLSHPSLRNYGFGMRVVRVPRPPSLLRPLSSEP